ncbi:hypothetical protein NEIELOOT_00920 [Neisseria elongata subsp. glycolytica ATCC 29315]|uniref:Uncharacterized protein n=1 Tax=Neisseria elongata subsp. glycolytica ATCC 29315 TaxID=546263 RepID=D4DPD3_NEIEG|nr:hypothetical protein NEIELOOT_00920 [Neisseria elongata subsp. glycolytica ATCC 29315]
MAGIRRFAVGQGRCVLRHSGIVPACCACRRIFRSGTGCV